jgi:hypothetical protein
MGFGAGLALFAGIAPASADVVTLISTGTVSDGADTYGLFGTVGSDLTGATFTAVYTFDLSNPNYSVTSPTLNFEKSGYPPFTSLSPGTSAVFTINNQSISYVGPMLDWEIYASPMRMIQQIVDSDNRYVYTTEISSLNDLPSMLGASFSPLNVESGESLFRYDGEILTLSTATVTEAAPVPLGHSTWPSMLFGLAGLGFMAYRRKSKPALTAG